MKNLAEVATTVGLLVVLLVSAKVPKTTKAQSVTEVQTSPPPNKVFKVIRQAGTCPETVSLWTISFGYRNSNVYFSETTVIADTLAIAGSAQLESSSQRLVVYRAALKRNYASCIGKATSQEDPHYKFQFERGNVYFVVDLTKAPDGFGGGITAQKVVGLRPYVIWIFAD